MADNDSAVTFRTVVCNDTTVVIRLLEEEDRQRLLVFGAALPMEDVMYFEDDYHSPEIINRLVNAALAENWRQVVAVAGDEIVGYSAVHRLPGWSSHVGDIRLLIRPDWRRCGLGTVLAQTIFDAGRNLGVDKVIVEMLATQAAAQEIFERLGFRVEGVLTDHARDRQGQRQDMLVLAYHIR